MEKEDSNNPDAAASDDDKLKEKTDLASPFADKVEGIKSLEKPEATSVDPVNLEDKEDTAKADSASENADNSDASESDSSPPNAGKLEVKEISAEYFSTPSDVKDVADDEEADPNLMKDETSGRNMDSAKSDSSSSSNKMEEREVHIIKDSSTLEHSSTPSDVKDMVDDEEADSKLTKDETSGGNMDYAELDSSSSSSSKMEEQEVHIIEDSSTLEYSSTPSDVKDVVDDEEADSNLMQDETKMNSAKSDSSSPSSNKMEKQEVHIIEDSSPRNAIVIHKETREADLTVGEANEFVEKEGSSESDSASLDGGKTKNREVSVEADSTHTNVKNRDGEESGKVEELEGKMESSKSDSLSSNSGQEENCEGPVVANSVLPELELVSAVKDVEGEDEFSKSRDKMNEQADQVLEREAYVDGKMVEDKHFEETAEDTTTSTIQNVDMDSGEQPREADLCDEKESEPVFDGTEIPGMEVNQSSEPECQSNNLSGKAAALRNFVKEKSVGAVSIMLRRLSGKKDDNGIEFDDDNDKREGESQEGSPKASEKSSWNPLSYFRFSRDADDWNNKVEQHEVHNETNQPMPMKGRVILYTTLGCKECKEARLFLYRKRLRYVEINVDVYPSRKLELERISGSSAAPKVFFNEVLIGGISEMKALEQSGKLQDKLDYVISEAPSNEAPLPPLSGEDDVSSSGSVDELALIVRKMKESIVVKDRFYRMRWFTNCFVGSEAVNFISEDQYLERPEAVEFGRKLASKLFFQHIFDENLFEDGNHFYRFLDNDPIVSTQCYNIPRGITEVKPKPISDISSRLRFLSYAIFDAYTSEDGKHVDYRSIHGSEEFARYLRIVEELQRVELQDMAREDKLAFFINLYNMMAIHAVLVWGHPAGPLERRKLFGDFKYVVGGCTYSLSAIQNGILRSNQRPPYNLMKPFGAKDKRAQVVLPYSEPLVHFALVCGTRSGPALRCYSPKNVDKELVDAAENFLRNGGLTFDVTNKATSVSKILKWFSVDFGKNEVEVLKHAANYLETADSEVLLELLSNTQLKLTYQPFDWGLNC